MKSIWKYPLYVKDAHSAGVYCIPANIAPMKVCNKFRKNGGR